MMKSVTRREFFRLAAAMGGVSLFAGCHLFGPEAEVPRYIYGAPGADALENLVGVRNVYSVCGLCPGNCGVRCRVAQEVLVKIGGSPFHPAATSLPLPVDTPLEKALNFGGSICAEGGAGIQTLYDPFRVVKPLKRVGERGSGKWQAISWTQAVTEVTEGGNLFGEGMVPGLKAMVGYDGAFRFLLGRSDWGSTIFVKRWLKAFPGARLSRSAEVLERDLAEKASDAVFGLGTGPVDAAYHRAACVISFGDAPLDSGEPLVAVARRIAESRSKAPCFRWAVVDPRLSTSASKSDLWVPVVPGRDRELALGIMCCFLEKYPESLGLSRERVANLVGHNSLDFWARACGLPVEMIVQLADFLAEGGPYSAVVPGKGIYRQTNGLETAKTVLYLNAMIGVEPGKGGLTKNQSRFFDRAEARLVGDFPLSQSDMVLDGQGLMVWQANPAYDDPSTLPVLADRKKIPLLVVIDRELTETAVLADYILPDTTYLERWDLCASPGAISEPGFGVRSPVVGAVNPKNKDYLPIFPETKIAEDILAMLGARLNLDGFLPDENGHTRNAWSFFREEMRILWQEMQREDYMQGKIPTDLSVMVVRGGLFVGEVKIPKSSESQRRAFQSAATRSRTFFVPNASDSDEIILISYTLPFFRSERSVVNSWLLEVMPENRLLMNTKDARRLGIPQGARVRICALDGSLTQDCVAQIIPGVRPGVAALAKGYGHKQFGAASAKVNGLPLKTAESRGTGINTQAFLARSGFVKVRVIRV